MRGGNNEGGNKKNGRGKRKKVKELRF